MRSLLTVLLIPGLAWAAVDFCPHHMSMRGRYIAEIAPRVLANKSPYRLLPSGLPRDLEPAFKVLWAFLKHEKMLFDELQLMEEEVVASGKSLLENLVEWEKYHGFAAAHHEKEFLSRDAFMALLEAGKPIFDDYFIGKPHTVQGHRVISIAAARKLERVFKDKTLYSRMYRAMGSKAVLAKLRWEGTGIDCSRIDYDKLDTVPDLFGYLHDSSFFTPPHFSIEADDFTNPLFVARLRAYLPGLKGWD